MGGNQGQQRSIPTTVRRVVFHLGAFLAALQCAAGGESPKDAPPPGSPAAGEKTAEKNSEKAPAIDQKAGTITLSAVAAKQGTYDVLKGAIEYAVVSKGGKEYEALFITEVPPREIHLALMSLGLKPGRPAREASPPEGLPVRVWVEYEDGEKKKRRRAIDEFVVHIKTEKPLEAGAWTYTGSVKAVDPQSKAETLQCSLTKNIIGLHYSDTSPLFQNPRPEAKTENIYRANLKELPEAGKPVRLIFEREKLKLAADLKRVHAFAVGRVQGVGYREFIQREARGLGVVGFAENLPDGRVEIVIEGPAEKVEQLLVKLARGPRAAQVTSLEKKDEPPEGIFKDFESR